MTREASAPPLSLAALQRAFQAHLLDESPDIEAALRSTEALPVARRLRVYASAYRIRLLGVLAEDYAKLRALMGDEVFERHGLGYLAAHPSTRPSLRWFGRGFAPYLAKQADVAAWHVEMARFEWAQGEVFDGPACETLALEQVAAVPPEEWGAMRFAPHATLQGLDLSWNVPGIWRDLEDGQPPRAPECAELPRRWVLWRRDLKIHWRSLSQEEATALQVLLAGGSFGEICEALLAWNEEQAVPARAAGLLKTWVTEGLLQGLRGADEEETR